MARSFNGTSDLLSNSATGWAPASTLTYAAWIKPTIASIGSFAQICGYSDSGTHQMNFYVQSNATLAWFPANVSSTGTVTTSVWNHVGFTYDNTTIKFYINGALDSSPTAGNTNFGTNASNFQIGGISTLFFPGSIAQVAAWSTLLTAGDFLALSFGARPYKVRTANLVGWWPLDGLQSPEPDFSDNARNMTLTGTMNASGPPLMQFTPRWPQFTAFTAAQQQFNLMPQILT